MKKIQWMAFLGVLLLAAPVFGGEQQVLKTQKDKENYTTGVEFVRTLKQQGGAVDLDIVIQGIKDGLTGEKLLMTEAEIRTTMAARQGGKTGQVMKADSLTGILPSPVSAGRENEPAASKKQEPLPPADQSEQNVQLAAPVQPRQIIVIGSAPAPNGVVLSKRNQAKLSVAEMKAERAKAFASDMP
jgi:hypothetical protein